MRFSTILLITLTVSLITISCGTKTGKDRQSIISTELEFVEMAGERGIAEAFYYFAADSAVILRGGKLIRGKEAIRDYYLKNLKPGTRLLWAPNHADVSGDLGYTWGKYTHMVPDSTGRITESYGIFHTVWKKQPDGNWRFVWD
ncbi:MAG TPA: hypothetical protein DDW27_10605 [Bacteroidales bacterium]|nr:hypothetical protein [Bacteroidales bacterium]